MMNKYYDISNLLDMNGEPITIHFENKHIKKINKILNNINSKYYKDYYVQDIVSGDDLKLLLDYIIKIREYYNDNVNKYEDLIVKYSNLIQENQQLKKQKDDVVEYIKHKMSIKENYMIYGDIGTEILRMLGEIDVED